MSKSKDETCGSCSLGHQPIRKSFNECNVCACGKPFFSQIVVENNLPSSRRCLIEIPMDFIEDHGHLFDKMDKQVILEKGDSDLVYRVKIGGNNFVGFGFEWKDFAQANKIKSGQIVVFTLVRNSRFLVQIYKPSNPLQNATESQVEVEIEKACPVKKGASAPKAEDDDNDDIEACPPQDWLAAKASRSNLMKPAGASTVKVEPVFSESSTVQAPKAPERQPVINPKEEQRGGIVPKLEADSEILKETCFVQPTAIKEPPVVTTPATEGKEERIQASLPRSSSENVDIEGSDQSDSSDSVWTPRNATPYFRRRRPNAFKRNLRYRTSSSSDSDEEEDEELVENRDERRGKRLISEGTSSMDSTRGKRGRPSDVEAESPRPDDKDEKIGTNPLIIEGYMVTKQADWHAPGTKRGRTYVSKRRSVTEAEKQNTLEKARQVHVNNVSFLKQLHKDSCYRALKLFPPAPFYRDHMISNTKGSYKATLEDENGKKWVTRIQGMKIFWKHFTLDHNLEEDDVVVFELMDHRPGSVRFLVHIFRVVEIKKALVGKEGWALYYDVVEGTKKQYFEERRLKKREEAQRLKTQKRQKYNRDSRTSLSRWLNMPD